jgi:hypothetical protein
MLNTSAKRSVAVNVGANPALWCPAVAARPKIGVRLGAPVGNDTNFQEAFVLSRAFFPEERGRRIAVKDRMLAVW